MSGVLLLFVELLLDPWLDELNGQTPEISVLLEKYLDVSPSSSEVFVVGVVVLSIFNSSVNLPANL